jgi:DHA2 family multidrug resistance protein
MIEKAAFVLSVNDAWAMLAAFALLGVVVVPFAWRKSHALVVAIEANLRE